MEILERTVLRNWMQQWLQWLKWYTTVAENPYTRLLTLLDYLYKPPGIAGIRTLHWSASAYFGSAMIGRLKNSR